MKTLYQVEIKSVFIELIPEILEDNILYISEEHHCAIHNCLCGCKLKTVTPLSGLNHWDIIKENNNKISLIGSVLNRNCGSHYIITKNIANFI